MTIQAATPSGRYHVSVGGHHVQRYDEILTPEALDLIRAMHRRFSKRRHELLDARYQRNPARDGLDFLEETKDIRDDPSWQVAPIPDALTMRHVEIVGPVSAKMAVTALNSGADAWIADFEDTTSPTWQNIVENHIHLKDAIDGTLRYITEEGEEYHPGSDRPTIMVRPRGWHLLERHIKVDAEPVPAALADFGLYFFHNAKTLIEQGRGPYFVLPKLESYQEAKLWNDVFVFAQDRLGIPQGSIRANVMIETLTAAFEMEEILYELRDHAAGLNAGGWDYTFSAIKRLGQNPKFIFPDRSEITMTAPFLHAYTELLVHTCHKRGAYAIGGVSTVTPSSGAGDTAKSLKKIRARIGSEKEREAREGFDGSWVSMPVLVQTCRQAFDTVLKGQPNQLDAKRDDVSVRPVDLLAVDQTPGDVTQDGVITNMSILVRYLNAWLDGRGAIVLDGQMEDSSTAEISRCQLWQWAHHGTTMDDGTPVTVGYLADLLEQELQALADTRPNLPKNRVDALRDLITFGALSENLPPFITEYAYRRYLLDV